MMNAQKEDFKDTDAEGNEAKRLFILCISEVEIPYINPKSEIQKQIPGQNVQ